MRVENPQTDRPEPSRATRHERRLNLGWIFFAGIALFYLLSEHRAHLFGVLPYLLLLACPLMHLFMHHGHERHEGGHDAGRKEEAK